MEVLATRNELDLFEQRQNARSLSEIQKIRTAQDYMADIKKESQEKQIACKERDQRRRKVLVDVIESKLKKVLFEKFVNDSKLQSQTVQFFSRQLIKLFIKILLRSKMKIEIATWSGESPEKAYWSGV